MSLEASDSLCGLVSPGASVGSALPSGELDRGTEWVLVCVKASSDKQVIDLRDGNLGAVVEPLAMDDGRRHVTCCDACLPDAWATLVARGLAGFAADFHVL